jgi:hypothetical protein
METMLLDTAVKGLAAAIVIALVCLPIRYLRRHRGGKHKNIWAKKSGVYYIDEQGKAHKE